MEPVPSQLTKIEGENYLIASEVLIDGQVMIGLAVSKEKAHELRGIFRRALNTWPEGPSWAFEFCDVCDQALGV